ncbi:unnamed protein product [Rotaria socialis]|nr:unnamed protein product [Rotaria socialis]CAF3673199.1 unnamed protein product [Rotaria socialis]CAF3706640.1 unnamed protein product [Rotaria socialis]CAF4159373.1 unnamed protein product [Rotaria socialis]CAF4315757.1 unnamed protein product [Rotaria socialis]
MESDFHKKSNVDQLTILCLCTSSDPMKRDFRWQLSHQNNETNSQVRNFEAGSSSNLATNGNDHEQQQISNVTTGASLNHQTFHHIIQNTNHDLSQTINDSNLIGYHGYFNGFVLSNNNRASPTNSNTQDNEKTNLFKYIATNIIGKDYIVNGPWGPRKMIYADYTASGRSLRFIENYIQNYVIPSYGNTHSENNACSLQTTKFRGEARALVKKSVNATDNDVVIFTGTGSTGAIHKLVNTLHLNDEENRNKTVIFISAFEHHSNILPWKETGIEIVRIPTNKQGLLDQDVLKEKLEYYRNKTEKHILCTFNAASNVTGIRTDVDSVSTLVHQHDGWIFWDYAAAAPYVKIDMNPSETAYKDAVFISTHKFVGGPGTPGILVAKKHLFHNIVPCGCGGGTVNFVTRLHTEYIHDIEIREEGGTPDIIGSIRAGLVFQLKDTVGHDLIQKREDELVEKFFRRFKNINSLIILGSQSVSRLAIFSFLIYVPMIKKYLHYNFICSLLNDLFGIQVRSGCACAGPYVLDLLGIDDEKAHVYAMFLAEDSNARIDEENNQIERNLLIKPGFTRLNLSYFASNEEIDYILNAIEFIATYGWQFLPLYTYNPSTGVWHHRDVAIEKYLLNYHSLKQIHYENGQMKADDPESDNKLYLPSQSTDISTPDNLFHKAETIAKDISERTPDYQNDPELNILDKYKHFIWFALPKDIAQIQISTTIDKTAFPAITDRDTN